MPKDMFFNISEEKRNRFTKVALEEFTTKPFEEVSVNTIIKKANISRGSFYTYFDNLESLFNYLMQSVKEERFLHAKLLLDKTNGDLFAFVKQLFIYDYDAYSLKGRYSLFKNYINFIQVTKKGSLKDTLIKDMLEKLNDPSLKVSKQTIIDQLKLSPLEFIDLVEVCIILMVNTFIKSENENLSKDEAIQLFNRRMTQLEFGVREKR